VAIPLVYFLLLRTEVNSFKIKPWLCHSFTTTLRFLLYSRAVGSVLYFHAGIYSGVNK